MADTTTTPKTRGRPRLFERAEALHAALGVFWRRGYEPASMSELCAAMGINPPSLYSAFGNKEKLFLEAVDHYEKTYWDATWERLALTADVRQAFDEFFHASAQILSSQDAPCGCLVILATTNISSEGTEVNAALKALRAEGREWFIDRIRHGVTDGQLPADTDAEALGLTLNTVLEGMSLAVRDGASRADLDGIATLTMRLFPPV